MWASSISHSARTAPRPHQPPSDSGSRHIARSHNFTTVVSHPPFPLPRRQRPPPRAALRGVHHRRSSSFLSSSSAHAPPLLLLMPCQRRPPCPSTGAPPESTTTPLPGPLRFRSFLREKALGPLPQLLFPGR
jgi:hypothetical protein